MKNQKQILEKLKIDELNEMQVQTQLAIHSSKDVILLSPTGTGKTLAFLLPLIQQLSINNGEVGILVIVPSRELAIQIEQVAREMGTGYKVNAFYGGRSGNKDKMDLKTPPAILIGTPGRIADRLRRGHLPIDNLQALVLDEFDKSLETGFEEEMEEILDFLPDNSKKILTSATFGVEIPVFVELDSPVTIDFLGESSSNLKVSLVESPTKDKIDTLITLLRNVAYKPGIVFCNFKNSIQFVSDALHDAGLDHGCFYGGLEQKDRERALIKFRNGTHRILLATDLAARGLDIPELDFIIHYQIPLREEEFIHRNGRTARMHADGTAFVLYGVGEELRDFIPHSEPIDLKPVNKNPVSILQTLFISGGRRDKISKGDIAGFMMKKCGLQKEEVGAIELKQDCAFVAVHRKRSTDVIQSLDNQRLKKKKVRVKII